MTNDDPSFTGRLCYGCQHFVSLWYESQFCTLHKTDPQDPRKICSDWCRRRDRNWAESLHALIYGQLCAGNIELVKRIIEIEYFEGIPSDLITYNVDRSEYAKNYLRGFIE